MSEQALPRCLNCGAPGSVGTPSEFYAPAHCGECPPWRCNDCGELSSMDDPCSCWTKLDGLPLADQKALLALGGLSLDHRTEGER